MNKRQIKKYSVCLSTLALVWLLLLGSMGNILHASVKHSVTIYRLTGGGGAPWSFIMEPEPVVGAQFLLWKLPPAAPGASLMEQVEELEPYSNDELDEEYGPALLTEGTDEDGKTTIGNLGNGRWYSREKITPDAVSQAVPFIFILEEETIEPMIIYTKELLKMFQEPGSVKLYKYCAKNGEKIALPQVGFELYGLDPDGVINASIMLDEFGEIFSWPIDQELGEDWIVHRIFYTDANGEIKMDGLSVGEYIWREVKPLPGYAVLQKNLKFSIVEGKETYLEIENMLDPSDPSDPTDPTTPTTSKESKPTRESATVPRTGGSGSTEVSLSGAKAVVPKTGERASLETLSLALSLFALGAWLWRIRLRKAG